MKDRAGIALLLSDEHLVDVSNALAANGMWNALCNVVHRHPLLNKFDAQRRFYTVTMNTEEVTLPCLLLIKQLAGTLKPVD